MVNQSKNRQSNKMRKSDCYLMDKGYDSEKNTFYNQRRNQSRFNYTCKREKKEENKRETQKTIELGL